MAILNFGSTLRTTDGGQTTTAIVTAANISTYSSSGSSGTSGGGGSISGTTNTIVKFASSTTLGDSNTTDVTHSLSINSVIVGRGLGNVVTNTVVGNAALNSNTTGASNSAFGYQSLRYNTTAKGNSAFGYKALKYTISGINNSAFGRGALSNNAGGGNNNAFGYESSTAINGSTGAAPMFAKLGFNNNSFGYRSLYLNLTGNNNCAFGHQALRNNKVSNQTAFGYSALSQCTTGSTFAIGGNTAVGSGTGQQITFGYYNTLIGLNAGSTGATPLTTGKNNTCLGNGANASSATVSNTITLGNSSITTLRCQVTTITALSDIRDKADIIPVDVGLSFIEKLRPVTFKWDKREWYTDGNRDGSKKEDTLRIGFIAQELKELQESENVTYLNLVSEDNPDKLEATPGNLMVPLIKAVQELNIKVKTLENKVRILENK